MNITTQGITQLSSNQAVEKLKALKELEQFDDDELERIRSQAMLMCGENKKIMPNRREHLRLSQKYLGED